MRIVINHLTRMRHPHICVAESRSIGPTRLFVLSLYPGDSRSMISSRAEGSLALGSVVELRRVTRSGAPPEVEDHGYVDAARVGAWNEGPVLGDELVAGH